jgi:cold shock CspA family protein
VRTPHEPVIGIVRDWSNRDGWGVLLTPDGLTVFCHYSQVEMDGY